MLRDRRHVITRDSEDNINVWDVLKVSIPTSQAKPEVINWVPCEAVNDRLLCNKIKLSLDNLPFQKGSFIFASFLSFACLFGSFSKVEMDER